MRKKTRKCHASGHFLANQPYYVINMDAVDEEFEQLMDIVDANMKRHSLKRNNLSKALDPKNVWYKTHNNVYSLHDQRAIVAEIMLKK